MIGQLVGQGLHAWARELEGRAQEYSDGPAAGVCIGARHNPEFVSRSFFQGSPRFHSAGPLAAPCWMPAAFRLIADLRRRMRMSVAGVRPASDSWNPVSPFLRAAIRHVASMRCCRAPCAFQAPAVGLRKPGDTVDLCSSQPHWFGGGVV